MGERKREGWGEKQESERNRKTETKRDSERRTQRKKGRRKDIQREVQSKRQNRRTKIDTKTHGREVVTDASTHTEKERPVPGDPSIQKYPL